MTRRNFVAACAAAAAPSFAPARETKRRAAFGIAHLTIGRGDLDAVRHGAAMGRREVGETGALLRKPLAVQLLEASEPAAAAPVLAAARRSGVAAVVIGGEPAAVAATVEGWPDDGWLLLIAAPMPAGCQTRRFTFAPTDADRAAAVAAWRRSASSGETARAAVTATAWSDALVAYGADSLNERFEAVWHHPPDEPEWLQWFAIKMAAEAAWRSGATSIDALGAALRTTGVDGHKGELLQFDNQQHLTQPLYVVTPAGASGATRVLYTWHPTGSAATEARCR